MSDLLKPGTYRLPEYQEAWLRKQAAKTGHVRKVHVLRRVIDEAMQKEKGKA